MIRQKRNPVTCQTTQLDHTQRCHAQGLWIMILDWHLRSTRSLPLLGSDVELSPKLSSRLTSLDETFAAAGSMQRQNRGAVATGSNVPKAHDTGEAQPV